jgi:hypothetical protein
VCRPPNPEADSEIVAQVNKLLQQPQRKHGPYSMPGVIQQTG